MLLALPFIIISLTAFVALSFVPLAIYVRRKLDAKPAKSLDDINKGENK